MTVGELVAYLRLDDSGFNRGLDAAGRSFGKLGETLQRQSTSMLGALDKFGGKVNSVIAKGLKAGIGVGMAAIGVAIAKGFGRLKAIDDARAKLKGLGHDTQSVEAIMNDALASVKGTAFGLDKAATTAAMAVAAGIKPGQDLERTLRLTADAAAIAGIGMDEMGAIFGKVASANRLTMQEINQLAITGIPVMEWLAKSYGTSAEEARKMVEKGEVDFSDFRKIVEENIGGAALAMGDSWSGAFANMWAAVSRFGAALIGPVFEQMKKWFVSVTGLLDDLTERVKPWAERFGQLVASGIERAAVFAKEAAGRIREAIAGIRTGFEGAQAGVEGFIGPFERIGAVAAKVWGAIERNREAIGELGKALAIAVPAVAALASVVNLISRAGAALAAISWPIAALVGIATAVAYAYQHSERFREIVTDAFERVKGAASKMVADAGPALGRLGEAFARLGSAMLPIVEQIISFGARLIEALMPLVPVVLEVFGRIADFLADIAPQLAELLGTIFDGVIRIVDELIPFITKLLSEMVQLWDEHGAEIMAIVERVFSTINTIVSGLLDALGGIISIATGIMSGDWSKAWEGVKTIVSGVWEAIKAIVALAANLVVTSLRVAWELLKGVAKGAWEGVKSVVSAVWTAIKTAVSTAASAAVGLLRTAWSVLAGVGRTAMNALFTAVKTVWQTIKTWFANLGSKITTAIGDLGSLLISIGEALIRGLYQGAIRAWNAVKGWFEGIGQKIASMFHFSEGPLGPIGYKLIAGLASGMKRGMPTAVRQTVAIALAIADAMSKALSGGLTGKAAKRVAVAGEFAGVVEGLLESSLNLVESLEQINKLVLPNLSAEARANVRGIVAQATKLSTAISAEINKVYAQTWVKAKTAKDAKTGKTKVVKEGFWRKSAKQVRAEQAAEASGPISTLMGFVVDLLEFRDAVSEFEKDGLPEISAETSSAIRAIVSQALALSAEIATQIRQLYADEASRSGLAASAESSGHVGGIVGDVLQILEGYADLTAQKIDDAIANSKHAAARAPELGAAMAQMTAAMREALEGAGEGLADITEDEVTKPGLGSTTSGVAGVVGSVSSTLKSLLEMTSEALVGGISGAVTLARRAPDLGEALRSMVANLHEALGAVDGDSLKLLGDELSLLERISQSIAGIVDDLSELSSEKIAAATAAGSTLGNGFYEGLRAWHARIIAEAAAIAADAAAALAAATPAVAGATAGSAGAAGGVTIAPGAVQLTINTPAGTDTAAVSRSAGNAIDSGLTRLAREIALSRRP